MARRELWDQVDGDLYQILGVQPDASEEQLLLAWRETAKREHPDRGGSVEDFQRAEIAYQVLSSKLERPRYDRARNSPASFAYSGGSPWQQSTGPQSTGPQWVWASGGTTFSGPMPGPMTDTNYRDAPAFFRKPSKPWMAVLIVLAVLAVAVAAIMLAVFTVILFVAAIVGFVAKVLIPSSKPSS